MIIFPMCGESKRFKIEGYRTPKFLLNLSNKTIFYHVVNGFRKYINSGNVKVKINIIFLRFREKRIKKLNLICVTLSIKLLLKKFLEICKDFK